MKTEKNGNCHLALFSRGIVFCKSLIAAPLTRNRKSAFDKMGV